VCVCRVFYLPLLTDVVLVEGFHLVINVLIDVVLEEGFRLAIAIVLDVCVCVCGVVFSPAALSVFSNEMVYQRRTTVYIVIKSFTFS